MIWLVLVAAGWGIPTGWNLDARAAGSRRFDPHKAARAMSRAPERQLFEVRARRRILGWAFGGKRIHPAEMTAPLEAKKTVRVELWQEWTLRTTEWVPASELTLGMGTVIPSGPYTAHTRTATKWYKMRMDPLSSIADFKTYWNEIGERHATTVLPIQTEDLDNQEFRLRTGIYIRESPFLE